MRRCTVLAVVLAGPCLALAQAADELWEITAQMKMGGMAMSAVASRVCKKEGADHVPRAEKVGGGSPRCVTRGAGRNRQDSLQTRDTVCGLPCNRLIGERF